MGPSSYTLQIDNIVEQINSKMPNIRNNYTVTDKADGDRKMLYIDDKGRIYLIDTNMNVQFTGSQTEYQICFNSLLDGEHIKYNKKGKFINLYKAFDIYFLNLKSMIQYPLFPKLVSIEESINEEQKEPIKEEGSRIRLLEQFIEKLKY